MNSSNGPIGLFDSGVGGLTVARAIARRLPKEDILYFGDTAHLPYGEKSPDSIRKFSLEIANHLIKKGAKIIVIACNSASAIAYEFLSEKLDIPVFNVIDPIIQELEKCKSQNIGIWGTRATINSNVYQKKLKKSLPNAKVRSTATPLLVPLIEENQLKGNITESLIKYYLDKSEVNDVHHLVLACTHYPLIASQISKQLKSRVKLLRTPSIVAEHLEIELKKMELLKKDNSSINHHFTVSDITPTFKKIGKIFFGAGINFEEENIWESNSI